MTDSGYASLGPTLLARKGGAKPAMRPQLPALGEAEEVAAIADEQLEDLGWNDMGDEADEAEAESAVVVPFDPATPFDVDTVAASPAHNPIVRRQQRRLEERLLADAVMTGPEDAETDYLPETDEDWNEDEDAHEDAYPSLHSDEPDYAPEPDFAPEPEMPAAPVLAVRTKPAAKPAPQQAQPVCAVPAGRRAAFTLRLDPERHLKLRLAATMRGVSAQVLVTDALDAMLAEFEELNTIAARLQRH